MERFIGDYDTTTNGNIMGNLRRMLPPAATRLVTQGVVVPYAGTEGPMDQPATVQPPIDSEWINRPA